jgi:hypothetical protein
MVCSCLVSTYSATCPIGWLAYGVEVLTGDPPMSVGSRPSEWRHVVTLLRFEPCGVTRLCNALRPQGRHTGVVAPVSAIRRPSTVHGLGSAGLSSPPVARLAKSWWSSFEMLASRGLRLASDAYLPPPLCTPFLFCCLLLPCIPL